MDFESFKWSPICAYNLSSSCFDIIIARVSAECSRLEVLEMEGMITYALVVLEKCKGKVDQEYFGRLG